MDNLPCDGRNYGRKNASLPGFWTGAARRATNDLPLVGAPSGRAVHRMCEPQGWHSYGNGATFVRQLSGSASELDMGLTEAMVRFAVRNGHARTVEDVLARRWRALSSTRGAHKAWLHA